MTIRKRSKKKSGQERECLGKRRQRITDLYQREMEEWKEMIVKSQEITPEERMEQIREKAYRLKAKREHDRGVYVKQCYDRQWRDASDEVRTLDSKARLDKLMYDRKHVVTNKESKLKESREDAKQREEWNKKKKK